MNREIKFRGKSISTGIWIYAQIYGLGMDLFPVVVYADTISQYTGLYDKNGKEIYEGDIVLQQGYNGKKMPMVVRFENGAFIVGYHKGSSTRKTPMLVSCKCEVIGNIYDNKDLLNEIQKQNSYEKEIGKKDNG